MRTNLSPRNCLGLTAAAGTTLAAKTILLDPDPLWAMPQAQLLPGTRLRKHSRANAAE